MNESSIFLGSRDQWGNKITVIYSNDSLERYLFELSSKTEAGLVLLICFHLFILRKPHTFEFAHYVSPVYENHDQNQHKKLWSYSTPGSSLFMTVPRLHGYHVSLRYINSAFVWTLVVAGTDFVIITDLPKCLLPLHALIYVCTCSKHNSNGINT